MFCCWWEGTARERGETNRDQINHTNLIKVRPASVGRQSPQVIQMDHVARTAREREDEFMRQVGQFDPPEYVP